MRYLIYALVLLVALVLQTSLIDLVSIKGIRPDFLLIALTYLGLSEGRSKTTVFGFLAGILEDSLGAGLLGISALAKSVAGFIAGSVLGNRSIHHAYELALMAGILGLLNNMLVYLITFIGKPHFWQGLLRQTVPSALYTLVGALIVFSILPIYTRTKTRQSDAIF
jgi:rod shape-determining protein MreD